MLVQRRMLRQCMSRAARVQRAVLACFREYSITRVIQLSCTSAACRLSRSTPASLVRILAAFQAATFER